MSRPSFGAPPACILLVRVEPSDESPCLGLDELSAVVLRVRHPLPALERMRVVRPSVVVIGRAVSEDDVDRLTDTAWATGSRLIEMGTFVSPAALRRALLRAVGQAGAQGSQVEDDLPVAKRPDVRTATSKGAG